MSLRVGLAGLCLSLLVLVQTAFAAEGDVSPNARDSGQEPLLARSSFLDAPPPIADNIPPAPLREGDERARRTWELIPSGGFSAPFCRGDALGLGRCGASQSGVSLGGSVLYRVTPYIALGLDAAWTQFAQKDNARFSGAFSESGWIGFVVRGYFLENGMIDPYVETGFGRGTVTSGYRDNATSIRTDAAAPTVMTGAGVDFWLSPFLRVGPSLVYRWSWLTDVSGCTGGWCETAGVTDRGAVGSYATLALRATLAIGREM